MNLNVKDFLLIAINLLITSVFIVVYILFFSKSNPKLAVVEINSLIENVQTEFAKNITKAGLSDDDRRALQNNVIEHAKKIDTSLERISKECECILVNKNQIYPNKFIVDYSETLKKYVEEK